MLSTLLLLSQLLIPTGSQSLITQSTNYNQLWARSVIDTNSNIWFCYSAGTDTFLLSRAMDGTVFSSSQRVNQVQTVQQDECEIYIDSISDRILVVWSDRSSFYTDYMAAMGRGYNNLGQPLNDEFSLFDTQLYSQTMWRPLGYPIPDGGFAVVCTGNWGEEVFFNEIDALGGRLSTGVQINSPAWQGSNQEYPCVAVNKYGLAFIGWQESNGAAAGGVSTANLPELMGNMYNTHSNVLALPTEFRLTETAYSNKVQREPRMAGAPNSGKFYMVWQSNQTNDWDIYCRKYTSLGQGESQSFRVNEVIQGTQRDASIATARNDSYIVVWEDISNSESKIKCRWFDKNGYPLTSEVQVNNWPNGIPNESLQLDRATPAVTIKGQNMVISWGGRSQVLNGGRDVYYRTYILQ